MEALPSLRKLPAGVRQATVGDAEVMGELFASFGLAMLTGVLCIYIVLVLLFRISCTRSPSWRRCRCRWAGRSWA